MTDGDDQKLGDGSAAAPEGGEAESQDAGTGPRKVPQQKPGEIGGPAGPEPTRYGDWEVNGRCTDF